MANLFFKSHCVFAYGIFTPMRPYYAPKVTKSDTTKMKSVPRLTEVNMSTPKLMVVLTHTGHHFMSIGRQ